MRHAHLTLVVDDAFGLTISLCWEWLPGNSVDAIITDWALDDDAPIWAPAVVRWLQRFERDVALRCVHDIESWGGMSTTGRLDTRSLCSLSDARALQSLEVV